MRTGSVTLPTEYHAASFLYGAQKYINVCQDFGNKSIILFSAGGSSDVIQGLIVLFSCTLEQMYQIAKLSVGNLENHIRKQYT